MYENRVIDGYPALSDICSIVNADITGLWTELQPVIPIGEGVLTAIFFVIKGIFLTTGL